MLARPQMVFGVSCKSNAASRVGIRPSLESPDSNPYNAMCYAETPFHFLLKLQENAKPEHP